MANLYNVPLKNLIQKSLAGTLTQAETGTITLDSSVALELQASASMPGILVIDRVDVNGNLTPAKTEYISFTGVSGSTVTGLVRGLSGTSAQGHAIGAIVELVPDVTWAQAINDVFTTQHNPDGTHKALSGLSLASAFINTSSIQNSSITSSSFTGGTLASGAILNTNIDTFSFNTNNVAIVSNISGAVNQITFTNSLISTSPTINATGTDTNINLGIYGKGTGYVYPQLLSGSVFTTVNSSATGTIIDVTGATVTVTPPFNSFALVNTSFDFQLAAGDLAVGYLNVNGTDQGPQAIFQGTRGTIGQSYCVSLASGTATTLKLRFNRAGTGVAVAGSNHTGFNYFLVSR